MTEQQTNEINRLKADVFDLLYAQQAHQNEIAQLAERIKSRHVEIAKIQQAAREAEMAVGAADEIVARAKTRKAGK